MVLHGRLVANGGDRKVELVIDMLGYRVETFSMPKQIVQFRYVIDLVGSGISNIDRLCEMHHLMSHDIRQFIRAEVEGGAEVDGRVIEREVDKATVRRRCCLALADEPAQVVLGVAEGEIYHVRVTVELIPEEVLVKLAVHLLEEGDTVFPWRLQDIRLFIGRRVPGGLHLFRCHQSKVGHGKPRIFP